MHSSALAGLSSSLNALTHGEMIEAKTRHVDWSEVDVDTFVRLCEFAYFRNYTPPSSRLVESRSSEGKKSTKAKNKRKKRRSNCEPMPAPEPELAPEPEPEPSEIPNEEYPSRDTTWNDPEIEYKERSVWTGQLRDKFTRCLVVPNGESNDLEYTFTPPENTGSWEDFTPLFLEQARLYVLADKYAIVFAPTGSCQAASNAEEFQAVWHRGEQHYGVCSVRLLKYTAKLRQPGRRFEKLDSTLCCFCSWANWRERRFSRASRRRWCFCLRLLAHYLERWGRLQHVKDNRCCPQQREVIATGRRRNGQNAES